MDTNEFLTRPDVNPLFQIRQLRGTASEISDLLASGSRLRKPDADLADEKIHFVRVVLGHLFEYLRELATVNEDLLQTLDLVVSGFKVEDVDGKETTENGDVHGRFWERFVR